jgi:hypothetical protein
LLKFKLIKFSNKVKNQIERINSNNTINENKKFESIIDYLIYTIMNLNGENNKYDLFNFLLKKKRKEMNN